MQDVIGLSLDEVFWELENKHGIKFTQSTLRNYVNWGVIPEPMRGGLGRGKGRTSEYQPKDIAEIVAAYKLLNGKQLKISPDLLKEARNTVLEIEKNPNAERPYDFMLETACLLWKAYQEEALTGVLERFEFFCPGDKTFIEPLDKTGG